MRLIDAYATHGQTISHYSEVMRSRPYKYGPHLWLPHDARAKSIQTGRSAEEQFRALGWQPRITPELSIQDGINAVRKTFPQLWIDSGPDGVSSMPSASINASGTTPRKCSRTSLATTGQATTPTPCATWRWYGARKWP